MFCGDHCNTIANQSRENLSSVLLLSFKPSGMTSGAWLWKTERVEVKGCT